MTYLALFVAVVMVLAVLVARSIRQEARLKAAKHRRLQQPLWADPAAQISDADMQELQSRKQELSNRLLPRQMSAIRQPASQLLSDRLIADEKELARKLKSGHFNELKDQIEELAERGWAKDEASWHSRFTLDPKTLEAIAEPTEVIEALLKHSKKTTPEFSVPWLTPHTVVEDTPEAAGLFVVESGWVTIKLSPKFFGDRAAAQAILAHEACHYILNNSGFRKRDVALNERYTDICMFICGFGQVFLNGYKHSPGQRQYRPGHRLGYLSDTDYTFIHQYVMKLRDTHQKGLQSVLAMHKKKLLSLVYGNQAMMARLVEYERSRTPDKDEATLYENAIFRLQRR